MIKYNQETIKQNPEQFMRLKDGTYYPYKKIDIGAQIDPFCPATFLSILKDIDYPYFDEIWLSVLSYVILNQKPLNQVFPKYVQKMNLPAFRIFTFKDSQYNNCIQIYKPLSIEWNINKTGGCL